MNVIASITVLGLLIIFHETGHFLAAILQGIRVSGFSVGFGPAILKKEVNKITFALRLIPLGGFVSFPDEESESDINEDDPNLLKNRPIHQRALVISAGVIANLFIAWAVLIGQTTFLGLPADAEPGVIIVSVQTQEAAAKAGLSAGDKILSVNETKLGTGQLAIKLLVEAIQKSPNEKLLLEKIKDDRKEILYITPSEYQGLGRIGAQLQTNIPGKPRRANDIKEIFRSSNEQFSDLLLKTISGYKGLFTDFSSTAKNLSGPVKIVEIGAQLSQQGSSGLILFAALLSINLAVLNSLPLPVLDGGQLMFLIFESISGKPIPQKVQLAFSQSGFLLLVGLSVVLIIRDTSQLSLIQQFLGN